MGSFDHILVLIRQFFTAIFGMILVLSFAGVERNAKNLKKCIIFFIAEVCVWVCLFFVLNDVPLLFKLYPFITHIPLAILVIACGIPWERSVAAVLTGYLCCEFPNLISKAIEHLCGGPYLIEVISYVIIAGLILWLLIKYVSEPIRYIFEHSKVTCITFSIIPLVYYLWCYATSVYTNWIEAHGYAAAMVLAFIFCAAFLMFAVVYNTIQEQYSKAEQEKNAMEYEYRRAKNALESRKALQEASATYRHDMRHMINLLSGYVAEGNLEKTKELLDTYKGNLDAITPVRYCANETVNIAISYFKELSKKKGVEFMVSAALPEQLPYLDTDICALVSNAVENATKAAGKMPEGQRKVEIILKTYEGNFLMSVRNGYCNSVLIKNGIPYTDEPGHGYGTKSIAAIAKKYNGNVIFKANAEFEVKVAMPL